MCILDTAQTDLPHASCRSLVANKFEDEKNNNYIAIQVVVNEDKTTSRVKTKQKHIAVVNSSPLSLTCLSVIVDKYELLAASACRELEKACRFSQSSSYK